MPIRVNCPHCNKVYQVGEASVGKQADCQGCGQRFVIAAPQDQSAPGPQQEAPQQTPRQQTAPHSNLLIPPTQGAGATYSQAADLNSDTGAGDLAGSDSAEYDDEQEVEFSPNDVAMMRLGGGCAFFCLGAMVLPFFGLQFAKLADHDAPHLIPSVAMFFSLAAGAMLFFALRKRVALALSVSGGVVAVALVLFLISRLMMPGPAPASTPDLSMADSSSPDSLMADLSTPNSSADSSIALRDKAAEQRKRDIQRRIEQERQREMRRIREARRKHEQEQKRLEQMDPIDRALMQINSKDSFKKRDGFRALRDMKPNQRLKDVCDALMNALDKADSSDKDEVLEALAVWYTPIARPKVIANIKSRNGFVIDEALDILVKDGSKEAILAIIPLMKEFSAKSDAIDALSKIGPKVEPHLIPLVEDSKSEFQQGIIEVLGEVGGQKSLDVLTPLLKSSHFFVKTRADRAIDDIKERLTEK